MIRRVRLRHWRSYESLSLEFAPGTTFVVAPNGVGKTSLVLGLGWAVFGDHADVDARGCIRAGADIAEVEAELQLPGNRELLITRQIATSGRAKTTGRLDGAEIDESGINEALESAFGVDLAVAARLSMMLGGGRLSSEKALDLKEHLYSAFGVADLLAASELAQTVAKEATKQRSAVRTATRTRLANRAEVEAQIFLARNNLEQHGAVRRELQVRVHEADQARRLAEATASHNQQQQRYDRDLGELLDQARSLSGDSDSREPTDAVTALRQRRVQVEHHLRNSEEEHSRAKGAVTAALEALGFLSGDIARCPTCLRPIGAEELVSAKAEQEQRTTTATKAAELSSAAMHEYRALSSTIADLLVRIESLRAPTPLEAHAVPDLELAEASYSHALEALEEHNRVIGSAEVNLQRLESSLKADDEVAAGAHELQIAYRREAISHAAAQAFQDTVSQVTEDLIEPIAAEVKWRWKRLFSDDGIVLRPDGTIVRMEAGTELGWATLSDGERIWARVITHLLVVASSTKLPFVWFDEPLEHLDPGLRQTVAATLATATQSGYPQQLLVTTYENVLARQLAEDTPNSSLVNVRAQRTSRVFPMGSRPEA